MPQSIRTLIYALTTRQAKLSTARASADSDTRRLIDIKLDELQERIDSLVEVFAK